MRRKYLFFAALCTAIPLLRCALDPIAGGSDGPDFKISGTIVAMTGQGAPDTRVQLLPANHDPVQDPPPPDSYADTTDANGRYRFSGVPLGAYTIQAVQMKERTRLLVTGIAVGTDTVIVPTDTLKTPGVIKIMLPLPDTLDEANGYFYIAGTTDAVRLKENSGFVVFDSVPAGSSPAIYYAVEGSVSAPHKIKDSVMVQPGETTTIVYFDWSRSRRLFLNTSASGANVSGDVTGFPVLVRLNRNNFNFAEAKSGGEDLRFTSFRASPLSFEIERWDAASGAAEVWVRVDTVFGNNATQYIVMHWGNASAQPAGSGKAVFDTAAERGAFQGVWHLGQVGNTIAYDATLNGFDGTPNNMTAASAVSGIIGTAQKFSGDSAYFEMVNTASGRLNFPENGRYTVSAWVYADTVGNNHLVIASKGYRQYFLKAMSTFWEFVEWKDNQGSQITHATATAKQWCHIAGVRSGASQYLFVNGTLADSVIGIHANPHPTDQSDNFSIGGFLESIDVGNGTMSHAWFQGKLDEIRISSVSRSADWIRLCYMNQKAVDALVVFR